MSRWTSHTGLRLALAAGLVCSAPVVGYGVDAAAPGRLEIVVHVIQADGLPAPDRVSGLILDALGGSEPVVLKPGMNSIDAPGSGRYPLTLEIDAPGWWARPTTLFAARPGRSLAEVEVWATGPVIFPATALRFDGKTVELPEARVVFCGCLDEEGDPAMPCGELAVDKGERQSQYEIEVPFGCRDLELVTEEFAAVTYDRVEPMPRRPLRLEHAVLSAGGSIRGRVIDLESGRPLPDVAVGATPKFLCRADRNKIAELEPGEQLETRGREVRSATTSYRGRFRLTGLEPGEYDITLVKEGFAKVLLREIPALEGSEYEIDAVALGPGATVEVFSTTELCDGEPVTAGLVIDQSSGTGLQIESKMLEPPLSRTVFTDVAAGSYRLSIWAACGARSDRLLATSWIEVAPRDRLLVPVDLQLPRVSGFVYSDKRPVTAELTLIPFDVTAEAVNVDSDADEGFAVTLPGEGDYRATVSWSGGVFTEDLVVAADQEELDFFVPSGELKGIVRDRDGDPVSGASVEARTIPDPERLRPPIIATTHTDDEGLFRLDSLPSGGWALSATSENRSSDLQRHEISDLKLVTRNIELIVEDPAGVEVSVVSVAFTPVSGATLKASWSLIDGGGAALFAGESAVSDENGRALVEVPSQVRDFRVIATAPGYAVTVGQYSTQGPVAIVLSREGGWIELLRDEGSWDRAVGLPTAAILFGGATVEVREPMWTLDRGNIAPLSRGKTLRVGPMAPGQYGIMLIETTDDVSRVWSQRGGLSADLVVDVHPGQTTSLDIGF